MRYFKYILFSLLLMFILKSNVYALNTTDTISPVLNQNETFETTILNNITY